jgi:hypothetical protein
MCLKRNANNRRFVKYVFLYVAKIKAILSHETCCKLGGGRLRYRLQIFESYCREVEVQKFNLQPFFIQET